MASVVSTYKVIAALCGELHHSKRHPRPNNIMVFLKAAAAVAALVSTVSALPAATNAKTSLRFIYHNNLNATDDVNHVGAILLDPMTRLAAASACGDIHEDMISKATLMANKADFLPELSYLAYAGYGETPYQAYFIGGNQVLLATEGGTSFKVRCLHVWQPCLNTDHSSVCRCHRLRLLQCSTSGPLHSE
jgi:hypothetical protein